jgi:radical SAM superfamily enzyme YgiQ (UPF0313 family)
MQRSEPSSARRHVLLVQLPIPSLGPEPHRGSVPLAAGYLALHAHRRGLDARWDIEVFPAALASRLGDAALVEAILARDPWMVGFTCYLWNVERTLWAAERLKARRPGLRILLGGPEIAADNAWVLDAPPVDFAAIGEGEQTFADLLAALGGEPAPGPGADAALPPIPGLYVARSGRLPPRRAPLARLDDVSSPYLAGILDAAEERMLFLETIRGCVFQCKFCYYPKSYDDLHFLSEAQIAASLAHAREKGVREVVLLDPTLNQRRDFAAFLRLLADANQNGGFTYFGELRAEGIDGEIAGLLRDARFTEVEIGLQSVEPRAQALMNRKNSLRGYERGVRALLDAGIHVKVDLIVGLPGDTPESVRRSMRWVHESGLYSDVQIFNLAVLPGTAFRAEAPGLGLEYQARPPYYVLRTPEIGLEEIYALVDEAEETFATEFDALPPPRLDLGPLPGDPPGLVRSWSRDVDRAAAAQATRPDPEVRAQEFTLWLRGRDLGACSEECTALVRGLLHETPHATLQVVLEPTADPHRVTPELLDSLLETCYREPTYLDRYHATLPGLVKGAKRLVVVAPSSGRGRVGAAWIGAVGERATLAWRGAPLLEADLEPHEHSAGP